MKKIISILLALAVVLGLTAMAAPVAAQCTCPATMVTYDIADGLLPSPPDFCSGMLSDYDLGLVTPFAIPVTLIEGTDSLSVDFPAGTDLSSVVWTGILIDSTPLTVATDLVITGTHLEAVIPVALIGTFTATTTHTIQVDSVINGPPGTYCLYIDYKLACCAAVQFACQTYTVAPATKQIGIHFDFGTTYSGIGEDYIPAFKACGDSIYGTWQAAIPGYSTDFDLIVRDENGGCNDPCTSPSAFWWEVTKCPAGEQIWMNDYTGGAPYLADATDIGVTKFSLLGLWSGWPPGDQLYPMQIHFSSPGDYELKFFIQCPAGGCPTCGGPTIIATGVLAATVYQFMDATTVDIDYKWNLVSLPLFPFDTSIENVLGSMTRIDQLVSVWYFGQCEDPDPDEGVWHTSVYDPVAGTFTGDVTDIQTGKAYWIRMLHPGDVGYDPTAFAQVFWVFGNHAIMPDPPGVDMGYFDVCKGWNMVGFKPPWAAGVPTTEANNSYLWNFNGAGQVEYGVIYEWQSGAVQDWTYFLPGPTVLNPGLGYWIPFDGDAVIYPKP